MKIPHTIVLTLNDEDEALKKLHGGNQLRIPVGEYDMPARLADHWYIRASGGQEMKRTKGEVIAARRVEAEPGMPGAPELTFEGGPLARRQIEQAVRKVMKLHGADDEAIEAAVRHALAPPGLSPAPGAQRPPEPEVELKPLTVAQDKAAEQAKAVAEPPAPASAQAQPPAAARPGPAPQRR